MNPLKELAKKGLYSPEQEHDACGVGVVANIKGQKTHQIIDEGVQVLINLGHRGAAGRDPETGDGAGMLIQTPEKLFRREAAVLGFDLPAAGEYGVGMVFLPPGSQKNCRDMITKIIESGNPDEVEQRASLFDTAQAERLRREAAGDSAMTLETT